MERAEMIETFNDPVAQALLQTAIPARLAYIGTDETPRVIPIAFYWTGREIVVCTSPTSPKARALRANPNVALTIDTERAPWTQLLVRGTVEIEVVDGIPPEYLRASEKSMPEEQWDQFAEQVRGMYPQMARITIVPTWAKVFDFSRGKFRPSSSAWRRSMPGGKKRPDSNRHTVYWSRRTVTARSHFWHDMFRPMSTTSGRGDADARQRHTVVSTYARAATRTRGLEAVQQARIETERARIQASDGEIGLAVLDILAQHDPMDIVRDENPAEYEPVVRTIVPRLRAARCVEDALRIIYEEASHWLPGGRTGPESAYVAIGQEVWAAAKRHR